MVPLTTTTQLKSLSPDCPKTEAFQYLTAQLIGAPRETRTPDPLITNQMLYQLSYKGSGHGVAHFSRGSREKCPLLVGGPRMKGPGAAKAPGRELREVSKDGCDVTLDRIGVGRRGANAAVDLRWIDALR